MTMPPLGSMYTYDEATKAVHIRQQCTRGARKEKINGGYSALFRWTLLIFKLQGCGRIFVTGSAENKAYLQNIDLQHRGGTHVQQLLKTWTV